MIPLMRKRVGMSHVSNFHVLVGLINFVSHCWHFMMMIDFIKSTLTTHYGLNSIPKLFFFSREIPFAFQCYIFGFLVIITLCFCCTLHAYGYLHSLWGYTLFMNRTQWLVVLLTIANHILESITFLLPYYLWPGI